VQRERERGRRWLPCWCGRRRLPPSSELSSEQPVPPSSEQAVSVWQRVYACVAARVCVLQCVPAWCVAACCMEREREDRGERKREHAGGEKYEKYESYKTT